MSSPKRSSWRRSSKARSVPGVAWARSQSAPVPVPWSTRPPVGTVTPPRPFGFSDSTVPSAATTASAPGSSSSVKRASASGTGVGALNREVKAMISEASAKTPPPIERSAVAPEPWAQPVIQPGCRLTPSSGIGAAPGAVTARWVVKSPM